MDEALVRTFRCGQCGAGQEVLRDGLVMVCERCGVFVAMQVERYYSAEALQDQMERARLRAALPTDLEARHTVATYKVTAASEEGDREAYRLWAREYHALMAQLTPEVVGVDFESSEGLRRWIERSVLGGELGAFEPDVRMARDGVTAAVMGLYRGEDAVAAAREVISASVEMYEALARHPAYAAVSPSEQPLRQGEEYLRMVLATGESALGKETVSRIRTEVLGDARASERIACASCGASIELQPGLTFCPYCGGQIAATQVDGGEPLTDGEAQPLGEQASARSSKSAWVAQTLATFGMGKNDNPGAMAVQQILMPFFMGSSIPSDWAIAFLEALSPRPALETVREHAALMMQVREDAHDVLQAVIEWCDSSIP